MGADGSDLVVRMLLQEPVSECKVAGGCERHGVAGYAANDPGCAHGHTHVPGDLADNPRQALRRLPKDAQPPHQPNPQAQAHAEVDEQVQAKQQPRHPPEVTRHCQGEATNDQYAQRPEGQLAPDDLQPGPKDQVRIDLAGHGIAPNKGAKQAADHGGNWGRSGTDNQARAQQAQDDKPVIERRGGARGVEQRRPFRPEKAGGRLSPRQEGKPVQAVRHQGRDQTGSIRRPSSWSALHGSAVTTAIMRPS